MPDPSRILAEVVVAKLAFLDFNKPVYVPYPVYVPMPAESGRPASVKGRSGAAPASHPHRHRRHHKHGADAAWALFQGAAR